MIETHYWADMNGAEALLYIQRHAEGWHEMGQMMEEWRRANSPAPLTDERIDYIADVVVKGMPDGIQGFMRSWGWRQFARAILEDCGVKP